MKDILKILFFTLLLFISCNENHKPEITNENLVDENIEFQNHYLNSPKLFSKFWVDMTKNEFSQVVDSLKKEIKIIQKGDSLFYQVDTYKMYLTEKFENGKLKKITLTGDIDPFGHESISPYLLFQEKYNLPDLINKPTYFKKVTIQNPDYSPLYEVYLHLGGAESIPNCFIDNKPKKAKYQLKEKESEQMTRLGIKEPIELNKDGNILVYIKEVFSPKQEVFFPKKVRYGMLVYSLEDWENEIPLAVKKKYGLNWLDLFETDIDDYNDIHQGGYKAFIDQKRSEGMGNYIIRKNSKYVTRTLIDKYDLEVTYTTKEYKVSEQNSLKEKEAKEREWFNNMSKQKEERRKELLEEI